jgi:serpin B
MLNYSDPAITVMSANSIWAATGAPLGASFLKTATDSYDAHAENVNLTDPATSRRISGWMKSHTDGHITGGIPSLTSSDGLLLVNALYFHGVWEQKFNRSDTRPKTFHLLGNYEGKKVPLMWRHGGASILYDMAPEGRFTAARLPYGGGSMSMYVFVPDYGFELAGFLKRVNRANWDKWMADFHHEVDGDIGLPKMSLRFDQRLDDVFNAMGMRLDRCHANLTPMGSSRYYVSQVSQQATLDVDEDGTTAAAITIELIKTKGIAPRVIADRPFFLAIRDDRSGAILFAGAIYDPQPDKP